MRKGREIAEDLKNIDCDPKLKIILGELAYNTYENFKRQNEIVNMLNMLIESHAKVVQGIGGSMNEIRKKLALTDPDPDTAKVTNNL